jgi:hypothetical protein
MVRATISPREYFTSTSRLVALCSREFRYWITNNGCQLLGKTEITMKVRMISAAFGLLLAALAAPAEVSADGVKRFRHATQFIFKYSLLTRAAEVIEYLLQCTSPVAIHC